MAHGFNYFDSSSGANSEAGEHRRCQPTVTTERGWTTAGDLNLVACTHPLCHAATRVRHRFRSTLESSHMVQPPPDPTNEQGISPWT